MNSENTFKNLGLIESLLTSLAQEGYTEPTPIQTEAIPCLLKGKDLLGCARTGTGKTAAFALPIIQKIVEEPKIRTPKAARALIVTPTRELAAQIDESFRVYGAKTNITRALVFGGVGKPAQIKALLRGVDVLVATPGRLLDLHGEGAVRLDKVDFFVLDEADRMLDMGFIHDMKKVIALVPKNRQTMLFSATMPQAIREIAAKILVDPIRVAVDPEDAPAEHITQSVFYVEKADKKRLLVNLMAKEGIGRALVFTRTKHYANRLAASLTADGIASDAIHGNKSQNHRTKALDGFKKGELRILVATDIAARGIDIEDLTHVINFEIPNEPETYIHRIGRTARAGASGTAISFCGSDERPYFKAIEKLLGEKVPVAESSGLIAHDPNPPEKPEVRAERSEGREKAPGARPPRRETETRKPSQRPRQERKSSAPIPVPNAPKEKDRKERPQHPVSAGTAGARKQTPGRESGTLDIERIKRTADIINEVTGGSVFKKRKH